MAFQEFMIAPTGATSFSDAARIGAEVYNELRQVIKEKFGSSGQLFRSVVQFSRPRSETHLNVADLGFEAIGIGDEGGFAPPISHPFEALDLLVEASKRSGHEGQIKFGIDPASSEFFKGDKYDLGFKQQTSQPLTKAQISQLYTEIINKYPVALLDDPFAEDDWETWTAFNKTCPIELVGDDLLATNIGRINIAEEKKACNSLLLKINQIGSISESIAA